MEAAIKLLSEMLLANEAHLRLLEQLEIERIVRETGESPELVKERVQRSAEEILEQVKEEIYQRHPTFRP